MSDTRTPVVLELASLPREQVGPFLLLGLEKDATPEAIESHWAQRVIWARKKLVNAPLEDINWAREVLTDSDRRARADASSLNLDTVEGVLRQLAERFGAAGTGTPTWPPRDVERPPAEFAPAVAVPDPEEVRRGLTVPPVPQDFPAVARLLEQLIGEPLDPWALDLPEPSRKDPEP